MGISFKKLAQAAALHAVNELSDTPLSDDSQIASVEAKGIEAFESLKATAAAEEKAFLATPAGIRKLLISKRAGQARLATAAIIAEATGKITTVQARRGMNQTEGKKGETKVKLTPEKIVADLTKLLAQPGALKLDLSNYDPAAKGAKPAPAPLLALRMLMGTVAMADQLAAAEQRKAG